MPPELIFGGRGVGELFIARNAGNLVDTATLGTVEYGATSTLIAGLASEGKLKIAAAIYDLKTGVVSYLD